MGLLSLDIRKFQLVDAIRRNMGGQNRKFISIKDENFFVFDIYLF